MSLDLIFFFPPGYGMDESSAPPEPPAVSDIQSFYFNPPREQGTYTITICENTTDPIAWSDTESGIQVAIQALPNIGADMAVVTGTGVEGDPFVVTFDSSLRNVPEMTIDTSGLSANDFGTGPAGSASGWTNSENAAGANDSVFASDEIAASSVGNILTLNVYGFTVPSTASVTGILLELFRKGEAGSIQANTVKVVHPGGGNCDNKADATVWIDDPDAELGQYGGENDTWGLAPPLTPELVNDGTFGFTVECANTDSENPHSAYVDAASATVFWTFNYAAIVSTVQEGS